MAVCGWRCRWCGRKDGFSQFQRGFCVVRLAHFRSSWPSSPVPPCSKHHRFETYWHGVSVRFKANRLETSVASGLPPPSFSGARLTQNKFRDAREFDPEFSQQGSAPPLALAGFLHRDTKDFGDTVLT